MAQDVYRVAFGLYQIIPPMNYHAYSSVLDQAFHMFSITDRTYQQGYSPPLPQYVDTVIGHREAHLFFFFFFKKAQTRNHADPWSTRLTRKPVNTMLN